jgi:hypothetical protein
MLKVEQEVCGSVSFKTLLQNELTPLEQVQHVAVPAELGNLKACAAMHVKTRTIAL